MTPGASVQEGQRLPKAPRGSGTFGAQYSFGIAGNETATLRADYSYRFKAYNDPANTESISTRAFGLANARATIAFAQDRFELSAFVKNLFDRHYVVNGLDGSAASLIFLLQGEPRQYGVTATARF